MNISIHLITSIILTVIFYPLIGLYSLWIMVGAYLIDFDHILWTMYRLKSFSIKKSYHYHFDRHKKKNPEKDILHIFHTIEFWIFMIAMSIITYKLNLTFFFYMFTITFVGMAFHLSLDLTDQFRNKKFHMRAFSIIGWIRRH